MSQHTPRLPTGNDAQATWIRAAHQELFIILRNFTSPFGRFIRTQNSIQFIPNASTGGKTETPDAMIFRGEWNPATTDPYMKQNVVKVSGGVSAGTFVSVSDNNVSIPSAGSPDWVQLASGDALGFWI
jgi:hypothetical protein